MKSFNIEGEFYCCKCGKKGFSIPRIKGKERKSGHLKKLYCIHCKEEINFCEIKRYSHYDYSDFLLEFFGGNFNETYIRKIEYSQFKDKIIRTKEIDNIIEKIEKAGYKYE